MFRAPNYSQLPAIMSGSDEVTTAAEGSEATEVYPTVWKDFCPTETTSNGEPARDGRIQNTDPDNQPSPDAPILITEQFRQTIFCGTFTGPSVASNVIPPITQSENVYPISLEVPAFALP